LILQELLLRNFGVHALFKERKLQLAQYMFIGYLIILHTRLSGQEYFFFTKYQQVGKKNFKISIRLQEYDKIINQYGTCRTFNCYCGIYLHPAWCSKTMWMKTDHCSGYYHLANFYMVIPVLFISTRTCCKANKTCSVQKHFAKTQQMIHSLSFDTVHQSPYSIPVWWYIRIILQQLLQSYN